MFIREMKVALLFGIHYSLLIVIQANVGGLVHITKQPTLGFTPTVGTYCRSV